MIKSLNQVIMWNVGSLILFSMCNTYLYAAENSHALTVSMNSDGEENGDAFVETLDENDDDNEKITDIFEPTSEWKPILKGQAIPKGLHVRINLETGLKEARLMEESTASQDDVDDDVPVYWKDGSRRGMMNTKSQFFNANELKEALKNFKHIEKNDKDISKEEVMSKFRSYEDLKEELKKLKANLKSETEIVRELIDELRNDSSSPTESRTTVILEDLEYYVHQVDNGVELAQYGGLELLVNLVNNSRLSWPIREAAAHCLGSAWNSNPKVQVAGVQSGGLRLLLSLLSDSATPPPHRPRLLFALSALVRHFPTAQHQMAKLGGVATLSQLVRDSDDIKLQLKVVTLMYDLIMERTLTESTVNTSDSVAVERLRQYKLYNLEAELAARGWCDNLVDVLRRTGNDLDHSEKVVLSMWTVRNVCRSTFVSTREHLETLRGQFDDEEVLHVVSQLLDAIESRDEL